MNPCLLAYSSLKPIVSDSVVIINLGSLVIYPQENVVHIITLLWKTKCIFVNSLHWHAMRAWVREGILVESWDARPSLLVCQD